MRKQEFLKKLDELKPQLKNVVIAQVDQGRGFPYAIGYNWNVKNQQWNIYRNGDRDEHMIIFRTSDEDEAFDYLMEMVEMQLEIHQKDLEVKKRRQQERMERESKLPLEEQKRLKEEREVKAKFDKMEQVFFCNLYMDQWIGEKNRRLRYMIRPDKKLYCRLKYIKEKRAFVIESATNKQDAENEILKVDPDIYYMDEPEKEMLKRLDENIMANYM